MQYGDIAIAAAQIEIEKWQNFHDGYEIHLEHPEFTALCPRSGYPDFGTIILDYVPDQWLIELKAFKLYINSFRDERISHENVVNEIANRLFKELQPHSLRLIGDFSRRGGIKTVITVQQGKGYLFEPYRANIL